jgi:D-alanyl-D-alanine dipeptidase
MHTADAALDWDAARAIRPGTSEEALVPVSSEPGLIARPAYHLDGIPNALPRIWVRQNVLDRLREAAGALPGGYRLVVLDGWRPKTVQSALFDGMHAQVVRDNPGLPEEEIERRTLHYAAKPSDDPACPSPHITGGSVDVTLADAGGVLLDMGSAFDEASGRSWTQARVAAKPRERRQILLAAMQAAGFTNLPSEWWHFDYGNWVWAWYREQQAAIYGPAAAPAACTT